MDTDTEAPAKKKIGIGFKRDFDPRRSVHKAHQVGPHSQPHTLAKVDRRTRAGGVLLRVREDLTRHVGGNPNIVERMLIERCAWLSVRIALLDRKIERGQGFTEFDSNTYLAWHNSLCRTLARLGIHNHKSKKKGTSSLESVLAEIGHDNR